MTSAAGGRVAIVGAMTSEIGALVAAMAVESSGVTAGFERWAGRLAGREVVVARAGMGKVAAAACVQRLIDDWRPRCVAVCGLAGGLADGLRAGDVVVGDGFVQHDVDASPIYPRFELPGLGIGVFRPAAALVDAAEAAARAFVATGLRREAAPEALRALAIEAPAVRRGLIVTGDQFVKGSLRDELRRLFPEALAVEMEGAVAQVCHLNQTPFVIVRVVSDSADAAAAADFNRFAAEIAPAFTLGIVRELLARLP